MIDLSKKPFYLSEEDINWVNDTLNSLSVDEKIGQLFFPIGYSANENYLKYEILGKNPGGLMFRSGPKDEVYKAFSYLQENSKIPMLLAANLEAGGDGIVEEGTAFGKQLQVAATGDPEQAYRLGMISCREGATVGCNYAFAPVVDIDMNYHNPITNVRTYGSNPDMVRKCGLNYMKAAKECGCAVAVKHFPGDGVDEVDQHILTSVNSLSCEEWDKTFGKVYQSLIDEGALTIMTGHIAMPAYQKKFNPDHPKKLMPASLSPELLKDLLRKQMGFNGMIITDASPMVGFLCAMDREKSVPYCIESGCDMVLFNKDYNEDIGYMKKGYEEGILSDKRLNEAVTRILATKAALKLHIRKKNNELVPRKEEQKVIASKLHLDWAKECADKSVTLVKDTQMLLPISPVKHKRVLYEILGECSSENRITQRFVKNLESKGFAVIKYEKEVFDFSKPINFETVTEFRNKYDLVIYIGNVENASNKTTNRIEWHAPFGAGNNIPWFTEIVPTLFISLQNPYHLLDVPMIKTYINAYSNHDAVIDAVVEKILGRSDFKGVSPIDPFCGKEYLEY